MAPDIAERVVLVEKVVLAIEVNQPVGVVRPVLTRGKVVLGTVRLVVGGRLAERTGAGEQDGRDAAHDISKFDITEMADDTPPRMIRKNHVVAFDYSCK